MRLMDMDKQALLDFKNEVDRQYAEMQKLNLKLDMSRGKPSAEQLELSMNMLNIPASELIRTENGMDTRNYGGIDGLPEIKKIFSELFDVETENVFIGGNSSLALMYNAVATCMAHGISGCKPWSAQKKVRFLCPVPGYDRHFAICEYFGIEMIPVEMNSDGPDMDRVEEYVNNDETIKGIWCVPMYSNPGGVTYSDETVRRFAALKPKAKDFRIFWDNAYCVHHLTDTPDKLLSLSKECGKNGNSDMILMFASTSKISFSGAGVAAMACFGDTMKDMKDAMSVHTIGYDKINQLRHVCFFKNADGIKQHMLKHKAIIAPKFGAVLKKLNEIKELDICSWSTPNGGYFVSFNGMDGCAKEIVRLCREAGVVLTSAGASFPYGKDPRDRNIRIAPTYPTVGELETAMDLFCICVKLASVNKLLGQ